MKHLGPGELRHSIVIRARQKWNPTGIFAGTGERYRIEADGEWSDSGISCTADGFRTEDAPTISRGFLRRFEKQRRMPDQPWFRLIAAVASDPATLFAVGRQADFTAMASGELQCFANDVWLAYWNNFGSVTLTIRRLP